MIANRIKIGMHTLREQLQAKLKQLEVSMGSPTYQNDNVDFLHNIQQTSFSLTSETDQDDVTYGDISDESRKVRKRLEQLKRQRQQLRYQIIAAAKEEQRQRKVLLDVKAAYEVRKKELKQRHMAELGEIRKQFQIKEQGYLAQLEKLMEEKGQLLRSQQRQIEELKKQQKFRKQQKDRYALEVKNTKEAVLSLERDRTAKYEKQKVETLKEQAITETEPKLLAIIKGAKDDARRAEQQAIKRLQTFKQQLKEKLERDITTAKQKMFSQGQFQQQSFRVGLQSKNQQKYEQRQNSHQKNLSQLRSQLQKQVRMQQQRARTAISEFINRNKEQHDENIGEIKTVRETYENKISHMRTNIQEAFERRLKDVQGKCRMEYQTGVQELDAANEEKYIVAETKLRRETDSKMEQIRRQVEQDCGQFTTDINMKYEQILSEQLRQLDGELEKLRKGCMQVEERVIQCGKRRVTNEGKIKAMQREKDRLLQSNQTMERKIVQVEGKIQSYEQVKVQHQKTLRNKCKQFQAEKQAELASLRATFLAREEHRVRRQSELLGKYGKQKQAQTQHLQKYKQEIQGTVDKKSQEVKKLNEEIVEIKNQNAVLHKQLQTLVRE